MIARTLAACCLLLMGCATPQEACIAGATRDLRILDGLIAGTEANLRRGYAIETVAVPDTVWTVCRQRGPLRGEDVEGAGSGPAFCFEDVVRQVDQPRAIDLGAERAKLASMRVKRAELARAAGPAVAACRAQHPG
jgi:hypothetical protein